MEIDRTLWEIAAMPFIYTPLRQPHNEGGLPDQLPFSLGTDASNGRLLQRPNRAVSEALAEAYRRGSMISGQMDANGIGRSYTDAFLDFMHSEQAFPTLSGQRVLEVGCGTGYLLYRIQQEGADVIGIEPGEHGQDEYIRKGVPIVRAFFPTEQVEGDFDCIVIYGVLEHVEDPAAFLRLLGRSLRAGGKVMIAVPDCAPYIKAGDISMLIHEHWSYFTADTLKHTICQAGFKDAHITTSSFGGFLYAAISGPTENNREEDESEPTANRIDPDSLRSSLEQAQRFIGLAKKGTAALADFVNQSYRRSESLGIYVPCRAINSLVIGEAERKHLRFFDDNTLLHGTYFPGINQPIESRDDLVDSPVDHILVMSHSFGDQIVEQLSAALPESIGYTTIKKLLASFG